MLHFIAFSLLKKKQTNIAFEKLQKRKERNNIIINDFQSV